MAAFLSLVTGAESPRRSYASAVTPPDTAQRQPDEARRAADYWKRKYDERIALDLLRSMGVEQHRERERIGF